ncbi:MAG: cytochrome c oxidase accessory protein CcoG [Polyangiales bacterium]
MTKLRLPVVGPGGERQSSLRSDGSRMFVHPADVHGRFTRARRITFYLLIAWWAILPFLKVSGRPALQLDVEHRLFFIFGATLNAQDTPLLFLVFTGVALALAITTAFLGRAWCGWMCPQTVFLEGLFRPIERFVDGPREQRLKLAASPWDFHKFWRRAVKHLGFILVAAFVAHVFVGYFTSLPRLWAMMRGSPADHPEAFAWAFGLTAIFYGNYAFFREQLCIGVCPYGRLQSVLVDQESLVVGYDVLRGEPRGKKGTEGAGDCVDCKRCIAVCPTGIDIRNGLQLDCIACTQCIDACDDIMDKLERPRGLIRYDSLVGLAGQPKKKWRPRLTIYAAAVGLWVVGVGFAATHRTDFEANLLRLPGSPFVVEGETVRNAFTIHLMNKRPDAATFTIEASGGPSFVISMPQPTVKAMSGVNVPVFVTMPRSQFKVPVPISITVTEQGGRSRKLDATFLGPFGGGKS